MSELKCEYVERTVIDNQLLVALDDKSKVAFLMSQDDLTLLIKILSSGYSYNMVQQDRMRILLDLRKLKEAAFPE